MKAVIWIRNAILFFMFVSLTLFCGLAFAYDSDRAGYGSAHIIREDLSFSLHKNYYGTSKPASGYAVTGNSYGTSYLRNSIRMISGAGYGTSYDNNAGIRGAYFVRNGYGTSYDNDAGIAGGEFVRNGYGTAKGTNDWSGYGYARVGDEYLDDYYNRCFRCGSASIEAHYVPAAYENIGNSDYLYKVTFRRINYN